MQYQHSARCTCAGYQGQWHVKCQCSTTKNPTMLWTNMTSALVVFAAISPQHRLPFVILLSESKDVNASASSFTFASSVRKLGDWDAVGRRAGLLNVMTSCQGRREKSSRPKHQRQIRRLFFACDGRCRAHRCARRCCGRDLRNQPGGRPFGRFDSCSLRDG